MPLAMGTGTLTEVQVPLLAIATAEAAQAVSLAAMATADAAIATAQGAIATAQGTIATAETSQAASQVSLLAIETAREARTTAVDVAALAQQALQLTQLALYWDRFDDAVDARDLKIDAQIAFMQQIDDNKFNIDVTMLDAKKTVITGLGIPGADLCTDAIRCRTEHIGDGAAVDSKAHQLAGESCGGIPSGWGVHEGSLMAAKSGSYIGGLVGNSAKRQREEMIDRKVPIVRAAHASLRSVFRSSETLAKYAQAAAIHSGLADIYLQGFNSAGAGLGVGLGQAFGSAPSSGAGTGSDFPGGGGVTTINTGSDFAGVA